MTKGTPLNALILAAGRGSRMPALTASAPKCMLEVGGRSLIARQIDALRARGIDDLTVVAGYAAEELRRHLGDDVRTIVNAQHASTNSLYSFWIGSQAIAGDCLVLNADVLFHDALLGRLIDCPSPDALLVDLCNDLGDEEMKVCVADGEVTDICRSLPRGSYDGENVGVLKFSGDALARLSEIAGELVGQGRKREPFPSAVRELLSERNTAAVATDGLPWIEIDFEEDLDRARQVILPSLERDEDIGT